MHGMAMLPSETNPHKARAATCPDRQLVSFSPFFLSFLLLSLVYPVHSTFGCNTPDFETRCMLLLTRATLLYMHIMRGGMLCLEYLGLLGSESRAPMPPSPPSILGPT